MAVLKPHLVFASSSVVAWLSLALSSGPGGPATIPAALDRHPLPVVAANENRHPETFTLRQGDSVMSWRPLAKDGADLPESQRTIAAAQVTGWTGETCDFDFLPPAAGAYRLVIGDPAKPDWSRVVLVR